MKILNTLLSAIYPNKCIGCGEIIKEGKYLCNYCEKHIERNTPENLCLKCGFEKENCVCGYNIYRFDALISVFKNEGIAQKAYYRYKFNKIQHYSDFFAKEMSDFVNLLYGDIKFDFICSVPSGRGLFGNLHYDHCGYIARAMSKILQIPYADDVLYCEKRRKRQHKSSIKERLVNVDGKYNFSRNIEGASVLLIDDIRTTGATLDECSKMLLFAGAQSVYCVTALATNFKSKKEN